MSCSSRSLRVHKKPCAFSVINVIVALPVISSSLSPMFSVITVLVFIVMSH